MEKIVEVIRTRSTVIALTRVGSVVEIDLIDKDLGDSFLVDDVSFEKLRKAVEKLKKNGK